MASDLKGLIMLAIQRDCQLVQWGSTNIAPVEEVKRRFPPPVPKGQQASSVYTLTFYSLARQAQVPAHQVGIDITHGSIYLGQDSYLDVLPAEKETSFYGGDISSFQTVAQLIKLGLHFNTKGFKYKALEIYIPQTGAFYSL